MSGGSTNQHETPHLPFSARRLFARFPRVLVDEMDSPPISPHPDGNRAVNEQINGIVDEFKMVCIGDGIKAAQPEKIPDELFDTICAFKNVPKWTKGKGRKPLAFLQTEEDIYSCSLCLVDVCATKSGRTKDAHLSALVRAHKKHRIPQKHRGEKEPSVANVYVVSMEKDQWKHEKVIVDKKKFLERLECRNFSRFEKLTAKLAEF